MKWWPWRRRSSASAVQAPTVGPGTESNPITRGSRDEHPVKYQCDACDRWFVEPESDLMFRDRGEAMSSVTNWLYRPMCEDCSAGRVRADWESYTKASRDEWRSILHE